MRASSRCTHTHARAHATVARSRGGGSEPHKSFGLAWTRGMRARARNRYKRNGVTYSATRHREHTYTSTQTACYQRAALYIYIYLYIYSHYPRCRLDEGTIRRKHEDCAHTTNKKRSVAPRNNKKLLTKPAHTVSAFLSRLPVLWWHQNRIRVCTGLRVSCVVRCAVFVFACGVPGQFRWWRRSFVHPWAAYRMVLVWCAHPPCLCVAPRALLRQRRHREWLVRVCISAEDYVICTPYPYGYGIVLYIYIYFSYQLCIPNVYVKLSMYRRGARVTAGGLQTHTHTLTHLPLVP